MCILGSFGNLLSFCVLLRANMRRYSTFCYLACLALVDLGVIITFCTNFISLYHFNNDIQNGPFACKLFAFCIYFLPQYSSWILVAVSIDRVISAKYLRLAKTWSKPRHSVLVTLLLGLVLGLLNSHFFLYENNSLKPIPQQQQSIVQNNRTNILDKYLSPETLLPHHTNEYLLPNSFSHDISNSASSRSSLYEPYTPPSIQSIHQDVTLQPQQQQQDDRAIITHQKPFPIFDVNYIHCSLENSPQHENLHVYWVWIDLLMNVFLPFTAMIACTIIIILTLVRSSTRSGSTSARRSRRRRNISVMLITVNLVFISLTAPIVIFLSIYVYAKEKANPYHQLILILIKIFCIILMNLNHSVNIVIYSVTAKEFRTEMTNFLRAVLYWIIGKPTNPHDLPFMEDNETFFSRFRRLRYNLFKCCQIKVHSNSTNENDSSGLNQTTAPAGANKRLSAVDGSVGKSTPKQKKSNRNGKKRRKSSNTRFSETSTTGHRNSHRLTVQLQADPISSVSEREDLSLHDKSNSTED
ncbi:unnamed protein product [Adineta steineri]|uniref:G-protein coupled receptors family 1 profile domain-containing protein n=1 Tax=Adineta steineri TaxID=433720 RepID=A0A814RJN2_9BILA|nr:unnamed protein product [Adineta steineri]CAF3907545.1 unnamed protein product [Adineta steineri]